MLRYLRIFCGIALTIVWLIACIMWIFTIPSITLGPITDRMIGVLMLILSIGEGIQTYNVISTKPERSEV